MDIRKKRSLKQTKRLFLFPFTLFLLFRDTAEAFRTKTFLARYGGEDRWKQKTPAVFLPGGDIAVKLRTASWAD
jgi:hypothetical protein